MYSAQMFDDVETGLKSHNNLIRGTVVKSFKYAGHRDTELALLELASSELIKLVSD